MHDWCFVLFAVKYMYNWILDDQPEYGGVDGPQDFSVSLSPLKTNWVLGLLMDLNLGDLKIAF